MTRIKKSLSLGLIGFLIVLSSNFSACAVFFDKKSPNPPPNYIQDTINQNHSLTQAEGNKPRELIAMENRALAPSFTLPYALKGEFSLSSLKGEYVLLDFTATWCYYCDLQSPQVDAVNNAFKKKGLHVIAVNGREPRETVLAKYPSGEKSYPIVVDEFGDAMALYAIEGYPTYILLDRNHRIAFRQSGYDAGFEQKVSEIFNYLLGNE